MIVTNVCIHLINNITPPSEIHSIYLVKGTKVKKIKPIFKLLKSNYISLRSHIISGDRAGLHKKCSLGTSVVSPGRAVSANTQLRHTAAQTTQRAQAFSYLTFCMPRKYISVSHGKGGKDRTSMNSAT